MSSRFASSFWMFHPCRFCFLPANLAPDRRCIFWFALATTGIPKPVMRRWRKPSTRASQESWKMPKAGWGSGPIGSPLEHDSHQIEAYVWFRCWSHSEDYEDSLGIKFLCLMHVLVLLCSTVFNLFWMVTAYWLLVWAEIHRLRPCPKQLRCRVECRGPLGTLGTCFSINIRWMEEILHQLIGGLSHYL